MKRKIIAVLIIMIMVATFSLILGGCEDADIVSSNLSRQADNFGIYRRIVFYNSIQDVYILEIVGYCSIEVDGEDNQLEVTVKIGKDEYQKHYLGLSDNVTYTVEQLESVDVSPYHYAITFKPQVIIPIIINESNPADE